MSEAKGFNLLLTIKFEQNPPALIPKIGILFFQSRKFHHLYVQRFYIAQ
ncbi:MAG: hypothetical protein JWQ14_3283 [Adhaeribacter sp.]|nr:hypothetical protein [Adhaeribacter sp.]